VAVDAGIGRLLISSLHQGIADISPNRLEFYENWLSPAGMRDGRIGLAPLGAVLSFLHREEAPANQQIVARAGRYAADWTFDDLSAFRRWYISRLPTGMRARAAIGLGKRLILATVRGSKVRSRIHGATAGIEINSALFDQLREPATIPMRAFYASAIERLLEHCAIDAEVTVPNDRPGASSLAITVRGPRQVEAANAA
jgi:hypothetical protein